MWYSVWTVLLLSTWLLTAFQSLQLNQGNICVLLPVVSWLCRHIDWVPTDVGPSLLLVRRCGTLYRNNCVILFTPAPSLVVYWRRFFFRSTSVYSALEADFSALLRYINSRFTYLLTYLMCGIIHCLLIHPDTWRQRHLRRNVLCSAEWVQWGVVTGASFSILQIVTIKFKVLDLDYC